MIYLRAAKKNYSKHKQNAGEEESYTHLLPQGWTLLLESTNGVHFNQGLQETTLKARLYSANGIDFTSHLKDITPLWSITDSEWTATGWEVNLKKEHLPKLSIYTSVICKVNFADVLKHFSFLSPELIEIYRHKEIKGELSVYNPHSILTIIPDSFSVASVLAKDELFKVSVRGEKGEKGDRGLQGAKGDKGDKPVVSLNSDYKLVVDGVPSNLSLRGPQGIQGIQGLKGETGAKGDRGERGLQGAKGEKGDKPVVSLNSDYKLVVDGVPSSLSLRGPQGIQGIQGLKGETGAKGDRGERGLQGAKGEKGDKPVVSLNSDYKLVVDGVPSNLSLRGPQGIQGIQGLKGETGAKGDRGERGLQGAKGEKGDKPVISYAEGVLKVDGIGVHNFNQQFAEKANIVELNNYATKDALSKVETRAIRPSSANAVGSSTSNPFAPILNDPNGESKVISLDIVEGTDLYLPPARLCAVGTKIYLRGSTMSCPITPYHHSTTIRPIRIYANERDVYSSGRYYSSSNLIETFTNAEWRVDLECIVAGCGLKGWLWVNSVECKNLSEFTSSITTAIQSIAEAKQEINRLKNSVLRKGEGLQLGFFNLVNHNSGTYHVKATDYHILARRTGNGDNYPYIRVSESLPDGHEFIVDIPFNDCRVRFVMPPGGSTWGNGGTEWQSGYRYHVTKSHTKEWGIIKTPYAQ